MGQRFGWDRGGKCPSFSSVCITQEKPNWRMLFRHCMRLPASSPLRGAGKSIPAKMAMMAITTSSSISVNPGLAPWSALDCLLRNISIHPIRRSCSTSGYDPESRPNAFDASA